MRHENKEEPLLQEEIESQKNLSKLWLFINETFNFSKQMFFPVVFNKSKFTNYNRSHSNIQS